IGKWDEAKRLLADTVNKGISPDVYIVNALVSALCKDGKIQEAISEKRTEEAITMLELLSQRGVKLYGVTYNIMIRLYCGQGEMNKAKDVFDSMGTQGL
ncbi:hypothetical protein Gorai_006051, partial [Gossypium raimondii]|nr:hypothetical protein [Gossypium raimondii]